MKLKEFKEHHFEHPYVAWLFDRKPLYALALTVSLGAGGVLALQTVEAAHTIKAPPQVDSPYQVDAKAAPPPSLTWAQATAALPPPGAREWAVAQSAAPAQPVAFEECPAFGLLPPTATATVKSSNATVTTTLQTYLPGAAAKVFQDYKTTYGKCWKTKEEVAGSPSTTVVSYPSGFFFTYGDAVVFVSTTTPGNLPALRAFYLGRVASTLPRSGCLSLASTPSDLSRNLFLNPKGYTGLIARDTIATKVAINNLPRGQVQAVQAADRREAPEGPLHSSVPASLPPARQKPVVPANPDDNHRPFEQSISYQVDDPAGPACGWAWAGLTKPLVDKGALASTEAALRRKTQAAVDGNAQDYVNRKLAYSRSLVPVMASVNSWNGYAGEVARVKERWQWLELKRDALAPAWEAYVEEHNDWLNFDNRKANALKSYNRQVEACNAKTKAYEEWVSRYGALANQPGVVYSNAAYSDQALGEGDRFTALPASLRQVPTPTPSAPTPTPPAQPTPTPPVPTQEPPAPPVVPTPRPTPSITIPPPPPTCSSYPEKPGIIDWQKPAEPQAPALEEGVTVPESWARPRATPSVALD